MTCAKRHVECRITTQDGKTFWGDNSCSNPQKTCPRRKGEGYAKCRNICDQEGHAEIVALKKARESGANLHNSHATVTGHNFVCSDCGQALANAGITQIMIQVSK